jgi:hypothetical protein
MNKRRVFAWITIGTNLAVLAGLILLVLEIRQNNNLGQVHYGTGKHDTSGDASHGCLSGHSTLSGWAHMEFGAGRANVGGRGPRMDAGRGRILF